MAGKPEQDPVAKAMARLKGAAAAAAAMEKARAALGMTTKAEEASARAADKAARAVEAAAKKKVAAQKKVDAAARSAAETSRAENAASSATAEAAALGMVEAAAAAAVVAVTALAAGTAYLASKAIEVVEQRSALLATFSALGGGAKQGKETLAMVDALSEKLPLPAAQIGEIAKQMESAGFRGKALGSAIEAVAAATAIMHDAAGGAAAQKMLQTLAEGGAGAKKMAETIQKGGAKSNKLLQQMGLQTSDVTKALKEMGVKGTASADQVGMAVERALKAKGGGPLAEMATTFPVMLAKLQEGFLSLFEGVNIKPFTSAVADLFGQFTRGKGPMKALGGVVKEVFSTLFKYAGMAVRMVSNFVRANFTAKSVKGAWNDIKGAISKVVDVLGKVWAVMGPIVTSTVFINGLAAAFKIVGVVVLIAVSAMVALTATLGAIAGVVGAVGTALWALIGTLVTWAGQAVSAGADFVSGLVGSIVGGIGQFVSAVSQMASAGLAAFKSIFKISSPSAVMDQMGGYVAEGAAQGVEGGQSRVEGAATKLGAGMAGASARGATGGSKGGGGKSVTINGGLHLHASGGTTQEQADEMVALFLDRMATAVGA